MSADVATSAIPTELTGLAAAIRRHVYGPPVVAMLGIRPLTPASDGMPPAREPCWLCGAIYDEHGKVLWSRTVYPRVLEPFRSVGPAGICDEDGKALWARTVYPGDLGPLRLVRPTGIRIGDTHLACAKCSCLEPSAERWAPHKGRPVRINPETKPAPPPVLTAKDRRAAGRTPVGRVWLAMLDAEAAGDSDLAGRLQTLLYRHRDREIDDARLDQLATAARDPQEPRETQCAEAS